MTFIHALSGQAWVERLGWALVHFLWQGVAIAALYAAARTRLASRASSQGRYLLACATLLLMTAAPIATWQWLRPIDPAAAEVTRTATIPNFTSIPATAVAALPPPVRAVVPAAKRPDFLPWVVALWMLGSFVFLIRLLGGWAAAAGAHATTSRRASAEWQQTLDCLAARLLISRPARLLVSAWVEAPCVVGWLRPVVLIPVGALAGLPAGHLESLLLHELAHIRRHDYLVNMLQSVVEALLFYHPAVWWISGQIRAEREACCDDVAVHQTGDTLSYACALADLESLRPSRLRTAVAANGASLADRVARLLGESRPATSGGAAPAIATGAILLIAAYSLFAQSADRPAFAAASIKPNREIEPRGMMVRVKPGGGLTTLNANLVLLIQNAYRIQAYQIVGGPEWLNTDGFDIEAKPDQPANEATAWLMLRSLLADRFKLSIHRETRDLPVYALTVAKGGPHLPAPEDPNCTPGGPVSGPSTVPCGIVRVTMAPDGLALLGKSVSVGEFIRTLASILGQPVIDKTGFTVMTDIHLTGFTPDENTMGLPGSSGPRAASVGRALPTDPGKPNIMAALQEQLGLKLEATKGPVEVVVIDHVERPTAN